MRFISFFIVLSFFLSCSLNKKILATNFYADKKLINMKAVHSHIYQKPSPVRYLASSTKRYFSIGFEQDKSAANLVFHIVARAYVKKDGKVIELIFRRKKSHF